MSSALVGLAGVILGAVIVGVSNALGARATFRRERGWEMGESQKARLEQIYETLEEVAERYGRSYGEALHIAGTQSMPPIKDSSGKVPWARLRMLTNLYLPVLKPHVERVYSTGIQLGATTADLIMESQPDAAHNAPLVARANAALETFTGAVEMMRAEIEAESGKLTQQRLRSLATKNR